MMINILKYLIVIICEVLIIPSGNLIEEKFGKGEIARKWGHVLSGTILWTLSYLLFGNSIHLFLLAALFTVVSTSLTTTGNLESDKRPDDELNNLKSTPLQGIGHMIFAGLSVFNPVFLLPYGMAVIALCIGDAAAALIGSKFGKYSIKITHNKSLIGFIAFVVAASLGSLLPMTVLNIMIPIWKILIIMIISALVELFSGDWDNLLIQLAAGFLTFILL